MDLAKDLSGIKLTKREFQQIFEEAESLAIAMGEAIKKGSQNLRFGKREFGLVYPDLTIKADR